MSPAVALFLYFIFVLFLLRLDVNDERKISWSLWIPLIWVLLILSKPLPLWLNPELVGTGIGELEGYESGTSIIRFIYSFLTIAGLIVLLKRRISLFVLVKNNSLLFFFAAYCLVSVMWSDYPAVSLKRLFRGFGALVMILIILTEIDHIEAIKNIGKRLTYILIPLSIVLIKYFPGLGKIYETWGDTAMWVGVTNHKNGLGRLCLISAFFLFWDLFGKEENSKRMLSVSYFKNILLLLLVVWLLYKADSATSTISLTAGLSVFFGLKFKIIHNNIQSIFIFIVFLLLFVATYLFVNINYYIEGTLEIIGHSDTFWGRTILWQRAIELSDNPLIGCGYDSFWLGERLEKIWEFYWWKPNEAHNGYIDLYLDLGLLGLIIWSIFMISVFKKINKTLLSNFNFGRVQLSFYVIFLLYNITESAYKLKSPMWFFFLLLTLQIPYELSKDK